MQSLKYDEICEKILKIVYFPLKIFKAIIGMGEMRSTLLFISMPL